jgi:hypothetical protein
VAAVRGLRDLHAVDEHVVRKCEEVLSAVASGAPDASGPESMGSGIRVAIAEALAEAHEEARPLATAVLRRVLTPKGGLFGVRRTRAPSAPALVVLATACSYVAVGGAEAAKLIDEIGRQCDEPLRTQLLGLVGTREA